jgi:phosphoribosylformylglycinamidine cyclo-ligase
LEILANKYPESYDAAVPEDLIYSGQVKLTDAVNNQSMLVTSAVADGEPAPIIKKKF